MHAAFFLSIASIVYVAISSLVAAAPAGPMADVEIFDNGIKDLVGTTPTTSDLPDFDVEGRLTKSGSEKLKTLPYEAKWAMMKYGFRENPEAWIDSIRTGDTPVPPPVLSDDQSPENIVKSVKTNPHKSAEGAAGAAKKKDALNVAVSPKSLRGRPRLEAVEQLMADHAKLRETDYERASQVQMVYAPTAKASSAPPLNLSGDVGPPSEG